MTRPLQPTSADFRKWRRLVKEARRVAAQPRGAAGDLRAAAATARRAVAPTRELLTATCSPLVRLAEAYPTLSDDCLDKAAETLGRLAAELAPHVNAPEAAPVAEVVRAARPVRTGMQPLGDLFGDQDDRPVRKDIFG
jgi:hypothetical protein